MGLIFIIPILTLFYFSLSWIYVVRVRSAGTRAIVFRHLDLVVRLNLPLPMGLYFAALGETGGPRRVLARCSRLLQTGMPLSGALRRAYPACSGMYISAVESAEQAGVLPAALHHLAERSASERKEPRTQRIRAWIYLGPTLIGLLFILAGFEYFIRPQFSSISADFDTSYPAWIDEFLASSPFASFAPTAVWAQMLRLFFLGLVMLPLVLIVIGLIRMRPRRTDSLGPMAVAGDWIKWHTWPWRRLALYEGCTNSLPVLRLATAAGWPLPEAVQQASMVDANLFWRQRLEHWRRLIQEGQPPVEAARQAGLPPLLLHSLAVGVRDSDLDPALSHAESYYAALLHRWRTVLADLTWPILTILAGVLCGGFAVAVLLPVRLLIDHCIELVE